MYYVLSFVFYVLEFSEVFLLNNTNLFELKEQYSNRLRVLRSARANGRHSQRQICRTKHRVQQARTGVPKQVHPSQLLKHVQTQDATLGPNQAETFFQVLGHPPGDSAFYNDPQAKTRDAET